MQYQLKPLSVTSDQKDIEKTIYVIARALVLAGFSVDERVYNQLSKDEQDIFTFGALDLTELSSDTYDQ